jgi:hypothetical protein
VADSHDFFLFGQTLAVSGSKVCSDDGLGDPFQDSVEGPLGQ